MLIQGSDDTTSWQVFERWAVEVNNCEGAAAKRRYLPPQNLDDGRGSRQGVFTPKAKRVFSLATTATLSKEGEGAVQCVTAERCDANTTLCSYTHSGHFNKNGDFYSSFPKGMIEEILIFFYNVETITYKVP
jgi:hypothetical protein